VSDPDLIESVRATIHLIRCDVRGGSESPIYMTVADAEALIDMAEGRLPLGATVYPGGPLDPRRV